MLDSLDLSDLQFDDGELSVMLEKTLAKSAGLRRRHRNERVIASGVVAVVVALVALLSTVSSPNPTRTSADSSTPTSGWVLVSDLSALWHTLPLNNVNFYMTCSSASRCVTEGWDGSKTIVEVTRDGGHTWKASSLRENINPPFGCANSEDCAATATEHGTWSLVETSDAGSRWQSDPLPMGFKSALASCSSARACTVVGTDRSGTAAAFYSTNGGKTWQASTLPTEISSLETPEITDIQCLASRTCVVLATDGVASGSSRVTVALYSTDGGASWSAGTIPSVFEPGYDFSCGSATSCFAIGTSSQSKSDAAVSTEDGGRSWTMTPVPRSNGTETQFFNWVSCSAESQCWTTGVGIPHAETGGVSSAFMASTSDLGQTWQETSLPKGVDSLGILSCPDRSTCYALGARTTRQGRIEMVLLTNHR